VPEPVQLRSFPLPARGGLQAAEVQEQREPKLDSNGQPEFKYRQKNLSRTHNDIRYNALA